MKRTLSDLIALQPELFSKKADETENSSEKQASEKHPPEPSAKSPPTTFKNVRIVNGYPAEGPGVGNCRDTLAGPTEGGEKPGIHWTNHTQFKIVLTPVSSYDVASPEA